jgi:hypothetical protein
VELIVGSDDKVILVIDGGTVAVRLSKERRLFRSTDGQKWKAFIPY